MFFSLYCGWLFNFPLLVLCEEASIVKLRLLSLKYSSFRLRKFKYEKSSLCQVRIYEAGHLFSSVYLQRRIIQAMNLGEMVV